MDFICFFRHLISTAIVGAAFHLLEIAEAGLSTMEWTYAIIAVLVIFWFVREAVDWAWDHINQNS